MAFYYGIAAANDEEVPRKRLESSRFQEIPVRVELQVRFDLAAVAEGRSKRRCDE